MAIYITTSKQKNKIYTSYHTKELNNRRGVKATYYQLWLTLRVYIILFFKNQLAVIFATGIGFVTTGTRSLLRHLYFNSIPWLAALSAGNQEAKKAITAAVKVTSIKSAACNFTGK